MNPGDRIRIHLHDTPAGFRVDMTDLTTGQHGSMTASIANGFGHILYTPNSSTCQEAPYAFHPEYSTANPRGNTWSLHTYNVAMSDEIGHFENCLAIDANGNCTSPGAQDPNLDSDDAGCLPATDSSLVKINECTAPDEDWDGQSYRLDWPGTNPNPVVDRALHPSPVLFTSPLTRGKNYSKIAFETDLPGIEVQGAQANPPFCDPNTGANCVNPPAGAAFYPFFSTTFRPGECTWQEGGKYIPGTVNDFGGSSTAEFGPLLSVLFPEAGFTQANAVRRLQQRGPEEPLPGLSSERPVRGHAVTPMRAPRRRPRHLGARASPAQHSPAGHGPVGTLLGWVPGTSRPMPPTASLSIRPNADDGDHDRVAPSPVTPWQPDSCTLTGGKLCSPAANTSRTEPAGRGRAVLPGRHGRERAEGGDHGPHLGRTVERDLARGRGPADHHPVRRLAVRAERPARRRARAGHRLLG